MQCSLYPIGFLFRDKEQPLLEHWYFISAPMVSFTWPSCLGWTRQGDIWPD